MGNLYLVSTPIGNLEDVTLRALRVLKEVDLIVCEDTRQTGKLLDHYRIQKPLESFFEQNERTKIKRVVKRLIDGESIALVTDAGTPSVSDPGYRLVKAAVEKGVKIVPLPGPSAVTAALVVSGLPTDSFVFVGFLPAKEGQRRNFLNGLKGERRTIVAFESPNRLIFALKSILAVWGDRPICVTRELTKIHEELIRGSVSEVIERFKDRAVKGEITLVLAGSESTSLLRSDEVGTVA